MDRSALEGDPHLVLEGMMICAYAIGSDEAVIYCRAEYPLAVSRLKQAIVNLLSNAVKFTPEGGSVGLQVKGSEAGERLLITVWDTGIGIKQEDYGKLFQPFQQLDSRLNRQYDGTGLGLALVKRLADMHGGTVELDSEPGRGSRFTILLPWSTPPSSR